MALYSEVPRSVNSASTLQRPSQHVTGQYVAKADLNRRQLGELAAGLTNGSVTISPLTVKQAAALVGVPTLDVTKARRANGNGRANGNSKFDGETLAQHLARSSPAELQEAARVIGVDVIWDTMVAPVITV